MTTKNEILKVIDMTPHTRNFDCEVIVLQKDDPLSTRDGDMIYRFLVADSTGSIILSVWGDMGRDIRPGDILKISGVNNKLRKGSLYISTLKTCKLKRIGQDCFEFKEKPNMSEIEHQQPPQYNKNMNNSSENYNQQQQQNRIPRSQQQQQQQQPIENNYNSNRSMQRNGYQNNNMSSSNNGHNGGGGHPYSRGGGGHHRGGYRGNRGGNRGGGRGDFHNNSNSSNRCHQDLDNPV